MAERNTHYREGVYVTLALKAGAKIEAGQIAAVQRGGWAVPLAAALGLLAMGRAEESADNSSGVDGDETVLVMTGKSFLLDNSAGADAIEKQHVGLECYAAGAAKVALTDGGGSRPAAGEITDVDSAGVWVRPGPGPARVIITEADIDFASAAAGATVSKTLPAAGAKVGDPVSLGLPANFSAGLVAQAYVDQANRVKVTVTNVTGANIDPPSKKYRVMIHPRG